MNLLSLNQGYNCAMMNGIERRPFSELGDQQLLEQARRLAANLRCLEVHILNHLDEIDRRGLALRRGFSSLFDYAVRELRFTDAAAQRRIQAMRLCRRHGWMRGSLQSGELSMTSAAQLETTFAGAERAQRQSHTGHRSVGQGRGHDQGQDSVGSTRQLGLPAAPGEADEQGERADRSGPGFTPPAAECSGDARERGHRSAPRGAPPDPLRGDPFAELSPGTVSAASLLHPQRQRELIEQAAGMSTREVAKLLAAAAPEVLPPRDTLRATAPDRYTLKVSIDQECEQGLRLLKDLMSHLDPRMSWGDLVARLVREAVARHNPRGGGGGGQRRKGADSAGSSPQQAPKKTRAAGAAGGPAQRAGESSGRAQNRTRADVAPVAPARRRGGATPAPPGDNAATRQSPIEVLANAAPPCQSGTAAPLDGACAGGVPSGVPAATSAPKFASGALADGCHTGAAVPDSSVAISAPKRAIGASPDGGPSGASDGAADGASAGGFSARAAVAGLPVATSAPQSVLGVFPGGGPPDVAAGAAAHTTRGPVHSRRQSARRRHIPAAVRRHIWQRDGGRCCYRDPLTGRRCTSAHLLQIDHLVPVAEGGGPEPSNLALRCFAHHRMRHGYGPAASPQPPI